jgi:hypothetical protein
MVVRLRSAPQRATDPKITLSQRRRRTGPSTAPKYSQYFIHDTKDWRHTRTMPHWLMQPYRQYDPRWHTLSCNSPGISPRWKRHAAESSLLHNLCHSFYPKLSSSQGMTGRAMTSRGAKMGQDGVVKRLWLPLLWERGPGGEALNRLMRSPGQSAGRSRTPRAVAGSAAGRTSRTRDPARVAGG